MRKLAILVVLGMSTIFLPSSAKAWGEEGHSAVCELAYRNFTPQTRIELIELFKDWSARHGKSWRESRNEELLYSRFMQSCMFEDKVKNRNELRPFKDSSGHYVNYPRTLASVPDNVQECPPVSRGNPAKCIFFVIDRDLAKFRDTSLPGADRAEGLIGLGHWVGDLHQPLHVSFKDDIGGGHIDISGVCGRSKNLHFVWDTCLLRKGLWEPLRQREGFRRTSNKRTIAHRLVDDWRARESRPATRENVTAWIAITEPWQWSQESYQITLNGESGAFTLNQYCFRTPAACTYDREVERYRRNADKRSVHITDDYIARFSPIVEERIRQAGYRLAKLVNETLDPDWNGELPTCSVSLGTCTAS